MGYSAPKCPIEADAAEGEVETRGGLQRLNRRGRIAERSTRTGPAAPADTCIAPTCPRGTCAPDRRPALATAPYRPTAPARTPRHSPRGGPWPSAERLGGLLPGGGGIPVERFPHRGGRVEQAGPLALDRPAARSRRRPPTSVSPPAVGPSEPGRAPRQCEIMSSVAPALPGQRRRPSHRLDIVPSRTR